MSASEKTCFYFLSILHRNIVSLLTVFFVLADFFVKQKVAMLALKLTWRKQI